MPYTLAQLRTLVRQRADMENTTFVLDAELDNYINDSLEELYDLLVAAYGHPYFALTTDITTVSGVPTYTLPPNFYKCLRVDVPFDGIRVPMRPWNMTDEVLDDQGHNWDRGVDLRYRFFHDLIVFSPAPLGAHVVRIYYVPRMTRLLFPGSFVSPQILDGWSEYAVIDSAIKCLIKEESDVSALFAQKAAMKQRIELMAPARVEDPATIVDARSISELGAYWWRDRWL